jgi:outer membrane protein assembly factor BamB
MDRRLSPLVLILVTAGATTGSPQNPAGDYPQWRGPSRDGTASAFVAPASWPDRLTLRWKVELGEGYATPLVVGDRVYTLTRRDGQEVLSALAAASGKIAWQSRYAAPHEIVGGAKAHGQGPKSTPLFHDGRLFTMGITGIVSAWRAADGRLLWQKPGPAVPTLYANSSMSPLVEAGAVIFHMGGNDGGSLVALDPETGRTKWEWGGDGPSYASPVMATFDGVRQVVAVTKTMVVGLSADRGALLWQRPFANRFYNNAISPVLFENTIIVSGYEMGVTAFTPVRANGAWETRVRWENKDVSMFMANPVIVGSTLYGLSQRNSGQFFALDARTGKVLWLGPPREATNTAVVRAGEVLFLLNDDGELVVARTNPERFDVVRRYTVAESATWAQPAIVGNRLFVKDWTTLALWTVE